MLNESDKVLYLHCYACDAELNEFELERQEVFEDMCEECYSESMKAAYDDVLSSRDFDDIILDD